MLTWKNIMGFVVNGNPEPENRVEKPETYWKSVLTDEVFKITRNHGTEPPYSGSSCEAFESGTYSCSCCNQQLFDSTIKYDSKSGWPSFTQPIKINAIKYIKDVSFGMVRVEIQCNSCDAHLGHVFPDGPEPSGLRYCVNSLSLKLNANE
ncbi:MAG: peptide-methionine (R)-S-oxide reductase MsrB [Flavobacteriaceae bacterium]